MQSEKTVQRRQVFGEEGKSESKFVTIPRFLFFALIAVALTAFVLAIPSYSQPAQASQTIFIGNDTPIIRASRALTYTIFFPVVYKSSLDFCTPIAGESYASLPILSSPTNIPAELHPDINLAIRGHALTNSFKGLVDFNQPGDPNAPNLTRLFGDNRVPVFSNVYQVYDWDWAKNRRASLISDPPVTMAGMAVAPGEIIRVPGSGFPISRPRLPDGYSVMVLYATANRVTLKYTREDNVVFGFTLHIEGICVEPNLRALYQTLNAAGRAQLPALNAGQAIGRASGNEIGVVIRDTGAFMDPRSRQDWWQETPGSPLRPLFAFPRQ